jgi:hypothetical protein
MLKCWLRFKRCPRWSIVSAFVIAIILAVAPAMSAQAPTDNPNHPTLITVELQDWLEAGHVEVGHEYRALTTGNFWTPTCTLPSQSLIKLKIFAVSKYSKQSTKSAMAIGTESSDCVEVKSPLKPLKVIAIISGYSMVPIPALRRPDSREGVSAESRADLSGVIYSGQVVGIPHLTMQVGDGPHESTLLTYDGP